MLAAALGGTCAVSTKLRVALAATALTARGDDRQKMRDLLAQIREKLPN